MGRCPGFEKGAELRIQLFTINKFCLRIFAPFFINFYLMIVKLYKLYNNLYNLINN